MAVNHQPSDRSRDRPLRIAMVVPPWLSVPPPGYGGLEQVVAGLVDALIERGNRVTVFGTGREHGTAADFVSTTPELQYARLGESLPELAHLARINHLIAPADFDVIHDHTTIGPLVAGRRAVPTVATVHGNPVGEYGTVLSDTDCGVGLVAISHAQRRGNPGLPWVGTVHNAMPLRDFPRKRAPGRGPVLWLARFSPDKGPDVAIRACRRAGLPLTLAGKCNEPAERRYFEQVVEPLLDDDVALVLNAGREATLRLLVDARCLIMPIQWEEPFGMVMVEAMATGTPVVALRRGAVPELVRPGLTGLVCDDPDELPAALIESSRLDPADCVAHVAENFSVERMAGGYESVYRGFLATRAARPGQRAPVPVTAR
ncbi:Glycosyltransferase involved in cell wall bisynthesis [Micromonospora narathiwatensis]|uniref:Glycosyltransferase involved in cell wall bisynthesis n=2 Tax=Micromonospora narathiwatensis TaxID=299146 RepID=A0A1A9A3C8_9ACTN|nr:Glycosyltransferase involved in cell wall bisynthesis [Micromonospora narathiwatensis]